VRTLVNPGLKTTFPPELEGNVMVPEVIAGVSDPRVGKAFTFPVVGFDTFEGPTFTIKLAGEDGVRYSG
jgi:hypothetical protein